MFYHVNGLCGMFAVRNVMSLVLVLSAVHQLVDVGDSNGEYGIWFAMRG